MSDTQENCQQQNFKILDKYVFLLKCKCSWPGDDSLKTQYIKFSWYNFGNVAMQTKYWQRIKICT